MEISEILKKSKGISIVGLSEKADRPSFGVANYLLEQGYKIIPINPNLPELKWQEIRAYRSVSEIPKNVRVDVVDIFRKSEEVGPIVDEAIAIGARVVWMQLGIVNEDAALKARCAGLEVVMDKCMKIEHEKIAKKIQK